MIEKGKISSIEMAILMNPTIVATGILIVPSATGKLAEQDMWISPIWASLAGFLAIYLAHLLNKRYPKKTVVEYSVDILGKIPGKVIGLWIVFFYLHINGNVLRQYAEFVVGSFLLETPILVVSAGMALVCGLAVRGGLEVIARSALVFVPIVLLLLFIIAVLLIPDLEPKNMFPIMENGIKPSILGAYQPLSWFSEFFLIAFMLPYLSDRNKAMKWSHISIISVMVMMVLTNLFTVLLFGNITPSFFYPVMSAAKYVSLADFIEHIESVVMAIWVAGIFIKVSVFYYAVVLGTGQWLHLSDYRPLVYPIGFLLVLFSTWSISSLQDLTHFLSSTVFYLITVQILVPIFLLIIAKFRKKRGRKNG